jgi:hypothetical protein
MPNPGFALQAAIHQALVSATAVTDLLGGPRIYDDVPRAAAFPYVTYGQTAVRDWGTGTEDGPAGGSEHVVTLHVWSKAAGRQEAAAIMGAVRDTLHDQPLAITGHRLVNLRHELSEVRREPDGESYRGTLRLRAVTEPL